jgi:glutamyl-tRNA synthetase
MPRLGIPLRIAVTGRKQTPAVDAVLALLGRETVLKRLATVLEKK